MTTKKFNCIGSLRVKLITSALILVFLLLVFNSFIFLGSLQGVLVFFVLALVSMFLYSLLPRSIEVNENEISINYPFRKAVITSSNLMKISKVDQLPVFRIGSQGYFGYLGKSMDGSLCRIADESNIIMVKSQDGIFLFSCENRIEFIAEARKAVV